MRIRWLMVAFVIFGSVVLVCPASAQTDTPTPTPNSLTEVCQTAVDGLNELKADLGFPSYLNEEQYPARHSGDFDPNTYFEVLDHLTMQEGYVLDYVYISDDLGGAPILYARQLDQEPFATFVEFEAEYGEDQASWPEYSDWIEIDDIPEGYIQFAILTVMGSQFYLSWHANYNDLRVICDTETMETLLTSSNTFDQEIPKDAQEEARQIDLTPTVELRKDETQVELITFTKWGGFLNSAFTFSRELPHTITYNQEVLVPYSCGVMF